MYLLNSLRLTEYIKNPNSPFSISNFEKKGLQHTFYYFRLGSEGVDNEVPFKLKDGLGLKSFIELKPGDFAEIRSHEYFKLSEQIFGIIGSKTNLALEGIQLLHSPFLDPGFEGHLKFGIANLGRSAFPLKYIESEIGKISFFNVSDSHPIIIDRDSQIAKKFEESQINN